MSSFTLTPEQSVALDRITAFIKDDSLDAFILRGSAGTGKTTLIAHLVDKLTDMNRSVGLLTPTGRAARILGLKVRQQSSRKDAVAKTIHSEIYSYQDTVVLEEADMENDPGYRIFYPLKTDEPTISVYVVDESSMVGDAEMKGDLMRFGSGRLLRDLITFARPNRTGRPPEQISKLIFVGDHAQLPPVSEENSPALSSEYLTKEFNLRVASFDLTTVMRQAEGSSILVRATEIRDAIFQSRFNRFSLNSDQYDIRPVNTAQAVDNTLNALKSKESSVVVVSSNALALEYNRRIRERLWDNADHPVRSGDILLINKNSPTVGLYNGDLAKVIEVESLPEVRSHVLKVKGKTDETIQLKFRDMQLAFRLSDGKTGHAYVKILENLLDSPRRELSPLEQRALLVDFRKRYPKLPPRSNEFKKALRDDPYFNAIHVKFGYAMTCHKAQGGEWETVIVDFESLSASRNVSFFRWAYTAITRASKTLLTVNAPQFDAYSSMDWGTPEPPNLTLPSPLEDIHSQLETIWKRDGISIQSRQPFQYAERYELSSGAHQIQIQYSYNKSFDITNVMPLTKTADPKLLDIVTGAFNQLKPAKQPEEEVLDPFLNDFRTKLETALMDSGIEITSFKNQAYAVRVAFRKGGESTKVDFYYNSQNAWTKVSEVGKTELSSPLAVQVRELLTAKERLP